MSLQDKDRSYDLDPAGSRGRRVPIRDDISYEDMKAFVDRGEYRIAIDQTYLIGLELKGVRRLLKVSSKKLGACIGSCGSDLHNL